MVTTMAAPRKTGARNSLGREVDDLLADWCAANYSAPATQVIREAVLAHIQERLDKEPELKKRFEEAKKNRLGVTPPKIVHLKPNS